MFYGNDSKPFEMILLTKHLKSHNKLIQPIKVSIIYFINILHKSIFLHLMISKVLLKNL